MKLRPAMMTAAALALGACAATPVENPTLVRARGAVEAAEADPNVERYAPLDLQTARKDLQTAESEAQHHENTAATQDAELASQNARLAQLHGAAKADDAKVAAGQAERDRIQLAERTREAERARQSAAAAAGEAEALRTQIEQLQAQQTSRGLVLTLHDVLFDTGQATLTAGADRKLDQLAEFLEQHPDRNVEIDGFTDSVGSDGFNRDLSERRANAVKSSLINRGIAASRISTEGFGKAYPVASNSEPSGRQLNRRVEVVIGGANGAAIAPRG